MVGVALWQKVENEGLLVRKAGCCGEEEDHIANADCK
jgi:hypothetical protein